MKQLKYILLVILSGYYFSGLAQQSFKPGNIVVYRLGDGSSILDGSAAKVYLDEFTTDGLLVQSILMPTTSSGANKALTALGTDYFAGLINLSTDGKYLVVPGLNASPGATTSNASILGLVDFNGDVNTSTAVADFTEGANIPWSGITDNGKRIWFGGVGALRYTTAGSTNSVLLATLPSQSRDFKIADGQLYISMSSSPRLFTVGNGLPVSGTQSLTALPGLPTNIQGPGQFAFADLDPAIPGVDVLYVASTQTTTTTSVGIRKFSLVNGSWIGNGNVGATAANSYFVGLTLKVSGNTVTLFATRQGANNLVKGGDLVKIVDGSGYNGTITGSPVVLASVPTPNTMAYRGVALVPQSAPFSAGNIIVYRLGDGSTMLNGSAAKVYLDEYTTDGVLVQSLLMPTAANGSNNALTALGTDFFSGLINLSADGRYLVVPGISASPGSTSSSASVLGLVDYNANVNTSTAVTDFVEGGNVPWSAISDDGSRIWFGGAGALRYVTAGSTNSVLLSALTGQGRDFKITDGQLYVATSTAPKLYTLGSGLPTSGTQSLTPLPGLPTNIQGPGQFAFADLDPTVPGVDVLYVASTQTTTTTSVGIRKFSLVNGTWVGNGTVGSTTANSYFVGLTLKVAANIVTLFATRQGANSAVKGGELVKIIDNSGYNGTITGIPIVMATAPTPNTIAYRGVASVPSGCGAVKGLQVPDIAATQARLSWNSVNGASSYEYAVTTTNTPPVSGTITANTSIVVNGLTNGNIYYVHVRTKCGASGNAEWSTQSFVTGCNTPAVSQLNVNISESGIASFKWNQVFGAAGYEYSITTSAIPTTSGKNVNDTFVNISGLSAVTQYYLHVRSSCGSGSFSNWISKPFVTSCFVPVTDIKVLPNHTGATWAKVNNASRYEYAFTNTAAKPLSGISTTDTFYMAAKFREGAGYYFHVRSVCNTGAVSDWGTIRFYTPGLQVYPNPFKESLTIRLNGGVNSGGRIIIADAMGKIIKQFTMIDNPFVVDTRSLMSGIYFVRYDDGVNKYLVQVMK